MHYYCMSDLRRSKHNYSVSLQKTTNTLSPLQKQQFSNSLIIRIIFFLFWIRNDRKRRRSEDKGGSVDGVPFKAKPVGLCLGWTS